MQEACQVTKTKRNADNSVNVGMDFLSKKLIRVIFYLELIFLAFFGYFLLINLSNFLIFYVKKFFHIVAEFFIQF